MLGSASSGYVLYCTYIYDGEVRPPSLSYCCHGGSNSGTERLSPEQSHAKQGGVEGLQVSDALSDGQKKAESPREDLNLTSVMEEGIVSPQDGGHQTNKQLLPSLPPLPRLHPSPRCPVSPPSDQVYLQAAAIFQQLHKEKPAAQQLLQYEKRANVPPFENGAAATQKQAYQLAFNTLKYQDLLEDVIADSCFHTSQHIYSDLLPLAMVMLFDFQDRRFVLKERPTKDGQEAEQDVRDLETSLHRCRTKLAASLARCRVKQNLRSISCFLSDCVRTKQHRAKCLPVYAWINTLKTSLDEVCEVLKAANLVEVKNMTDLMDSAFCRDPLCPDTLVFSYRLHAFLQGCTLTATHLLNIQDRSVCVAVSVLQPLLFDKGDVLVAGSFSAVTVAHVAVVAAARSGRVLLCGADHTPSQVEGMQTLLTQMGIKNVRVLSGPFCGLNEWDATAQRLKVTVVLPQCSSSALNDPVATMHSEHGDWDLLPDLSCGSVSKKKIHSLTSQQARLLGHALSFSKVQTVVYCTRSVYPEENEQLVGRVLEKTYSHPRLLPFRVNGPIFPDDSPSGDTADSKFFKLGPSQFTNGCFVARLSRQTDPTKVESVQDVLARAAAKGLLGDVISEPSKTGKKKKSKKNRAASAASKPSSPSCQGGEEEGESGNGRDSEDTSEHEEEKDEGEPDDGEENVGERTDDKGKGEKKLRRRKRNPKQSKEAPTDAKSHKKKTKKKENQSQVKKKQVSNKPRRIPRLTLTLISSAHPSRHLSPITALAHKISGNPAVKPQQAALGSPPLSGKQSSPAPPAPATSHEAPRRQPPPTRRSRANTGGGRQTTDTGSDETC
ncbi:putative methyltransferase NSUN7 [Kryptolebias marmoratus]|uniref:putative methyltransferase NSUN7 n=1 Tax=Kryptolebias marmoratus TaxID=37003 RepID=UPI0018ACC309|nr:putative methyltransferase NSUN7 [Kryptolebias marmoratus]